MYVISRVLTFQKGYREQINAHFNKMKMMDSFPGFVRRDILINDKDPNQDTVRVLIYWEIKEAYYRFEGSKEHIAMHKDKTSDHHQKPIGLIDVIKESYDVIESYSNVK